MMIRVMRTLAIVAAVAACGSAPSGTPAQILDLSTSDAELRREFDAHSGEPRFVALLSPT